MPLEGHWDRQHTPLRDSSARESRVLIGVVCALVVAVGVLLYAVLATSSRREPTGCITVTAATSTGGALLRECGHNARAWCRAERGLKDPTALAVQERCRRAGIR